MDAAQTYITRRLPATQDERVREEVYVVREINLRAYVCSARLVVVEVGGNRR